MNNFIFIATGSDATEESTEYSLDDIYKKLDEVDQRVSDFQLSSTQKKGSMEAAQNNTSAGTPTDIYLASITDASTEIAQNTSAIGSWIVVIAFIIVLFECKKMIRGSIKSWLDRK